MGRIDGPNIVERCFSENFMSSQRKLFEFDCRDWPQLSLRLSTQNQSGRRTDLEAIY